MSELSLRLPALVGSALFLYILPLLLERLVFGVWFQRLLMMLLILNPLTLDLLCVARGYSLALAFFAFAALQLSFYVERLQAKHLAWMSTSLGLCCCANLSFGFVCIALLAIATVIVIRNENWKSLQTVFAPAIGVTMMVLILPLSRAQQDNFYWGAATLKQSLGDTVTPFLRHDPYQSGPFGNARMVARFERRFLPVALAILLFAGIRWALRGEQTLLTPLISAFAVSLFGYWLAHVWLLAPYPSERTGVPLAFLFMLVFGATISYLLRYRTTTTWIITVPAILILLALVVQFITQLEPAYLWAWHQERDNRQIADLLRTRGAKKISSAWLFQPALEFYRRAGRIPAAAPLQRFQGDNPPLTGHDAYVLLRPDPRALAANHLAVAWHSEVTGVAVAVPVLNQ